MTRTILVLGATGNQGGATVNALRGTDFAVRALVRRGTENKEAVSGDLDDPDSLARAMRGVYGVFSVLNFRDGGVAAEEERGRRVADVAKAAGVEHFVYSSVGGADRNSGVPHFESKWRVEQHIRQIGLPHTMLRPTTFMTNLHEMSGLTRFMALSVSRGAMDDAIPLQMIAIRDIGRWAAHVFNDPDQYLGHAVEIAGDAVTFEQMMQAYQRVYGRRPRSMTLPSSWALRGDMGRMFTWISTQGYRADLELNRATIPDLLTFEQFLARHTVS